MRIGGLGGNWNFRSQELSHPGAKMTFVLGSIKCHGTCWEQKSHETFVSSYQYWGIKSSAI